MFLNGRPLAFFLATLVLVGACTTEPSLQTPVQPAIAPIDCDDTGECVNGFTLDESIYVFVCSSSVAPGFRGEILATPSTTDSWPQVPISEVRSIPGIDLAIGVAVSISSQDCPDRKSDWVLSVPLDDTASPGFAARDEERQRLIETLSADT